MRLIDAHELEEKFNKATMNPDHGGEIWHITGIRAFIINAPTIEAEPVKHGHWIISSDGYYPYCSICRKEPESRKMSDYCPSCGTKMDGGETQCD